MMFTPEAGVILLGCCIAMVIHGLVLIVWRHRKHQRRLHEAHR